MVARATRIIVAAVAAFVVVAVGRSALAAPATPQLTVDPTVAGLDVTDPTLAAGTSGAETWTVSIGVDHYPNAPELQSAANDAIAVDTHLAAAGIAQSHRVLLLDDAATSEAVRSALGWLSAVAGPEDHIVLFLSGHATNPYADRHALRLADGQDLYDTEIASLLAAVESSMWIIAATCYGAGFDELTTDSNRVLTAAADADGLAFENLDWGHSYLVEYLFNRTETPLVSGNEPAVAAQATVLDVDHPTRAVVHVG